MLCKELFLQSDVFGSFDSQIFELVAHVFFHGRRLDGIGILLEQCFEGGNIRVHGFFLILCETSCRAQRSTPHWRTVPVSLTPSARLSLRVPYLWRWRIFRIIWLDKLHKPIFVSLICHR